MELDPPHNKQQHPHPPPVIIIINQICGKRKKLANQHLQELEGNK